MLEELYEAIGEDEILKTIMNSKSNSLYVKIPFDREIDIEKDILNTDMKEDISVKDLKLFQWFKEREFYTDYIASNKAKVSGKSFKYQKVVMTNQANGIRFNNKKVVEKMKEYKQSLYDTLYGICLEFLEVLDKKDYIDMYEKAIKILIKDYEEILLSDKKIAIKMYLDVSIEDYKALYEEDLNNNLLEGTIKNNRGTFTLFATNNNKKPFLKMSTNIHNNDSSYKTDIETAKKLRLLKKYLEQSSKKELEYKNGYIEYKNTKDGLSEYEYYPFKKFNIFEENPLYLNNFMIDTSDKFSWKVSLLTTNDGSHDVKVFKEIYEKYYNNLSNLNKDKFKRIFNKMINSLYSLANRKYKEDKQYIDLIDFEINVRDYFFKTKLMEEYEIMKNIIKEKIIMSSKADYEISNDDEFWYLVGTVASYLIRQSKSTNRFLLKLNYSSCNEFNKILKKLDDDFNRFGYELNDYYTCTKLYGAILNYTDNIKTLDKLKFKQGLFEQSNLCYTKIKNNEVEGEKKDEE